MDAPCGCCRCAARQPGREHRVAAARRRARRCRVQPCCGRARRERPRHPARHHTCRGPRQTTVFCATRSGLSTPPSTHSSTTTTHRTPNASMPRRSIVPGSSRGRSFPAAHRPSSTSSFLEITRQAIQLRDVAIRMPRRLRSLSLLSPALSLRRCQMKCFLSFMLVLAASAQAFAQQTAAFEGRLVNSLSGDADRRRDGRASKS